jgi:hypothetical protein
MTMQKLITETERELDEMHKPGDCAFYPDRDVTTEVIDNAFEQVQFGDVINIAYSWYRPVAQKMKPSITIRDHYGDIQTIYRNKCELTGKW